MTDRQRDLIDLIEYAQLGFDHYKKDLQHNESIFFATMDSKLEEQLTNENKSRLYFPKAQAKAKTLSDQIDKAYFSNDKFASIGEADEKDSKLAGLLEDAVYDYTKKANMFKALQEGVYKIPFIGTIASRTYWNNGLVIENVNIEDLHFDPDATSYDDTRYLVHRVFLAKEDIKALQKSKVFTKDHNIDELVSDDDAKSYTRIEFKEIYTKVNDEWKVSTVYDDTYFFREDVVLKDGHPFNWGGCLPQLKKIDEENFVANYSEPVISSIKSLQEEYNARRNQVIDGIRQQLNPKKIIPTNSGINPTDINSPVGVMKSNNPTAITIVPPADVRGAMSDMQIIDQDMSEITGISPMMSGVSNDKNKTATEKSIEHSSGSAKLEIYIRNLNETFFEPLINRIVSLVYKYGADKYFIGIDRSLELPELNIDFEVGLGVTNDVVRTQQLSQAIGNFNGLFQMAMALQDVEEAKVIYEATKKLQRELMPLNGIKNVDKYLPEEDERLGEENANINGFTPISEQPMLESNQTAPIGY